MKKLLVFLAIAAATLLFVGIALSFFIGSIAKQGVNTLAPKITGSPVTLESARISPWNGIGTLQGLFVGNPQGWQSDRLAYIEKLHLELDPMSLLSDTIVVENVVLEQPEFVYETKLISSNVKELLAQIEKNIGGPKPGKPAANEGSGKKFAIKRINLKGAKVTIGIGPAAVTVPMPDLELVDLGTRENGLNASQLALEVTKQIIPRVIEAASGALMTVGGTTGAAAIDGVKKIGEGIKDIFSGEKPKP